jgi:hypothetical protein
MQAGRETTCARRATADWPYHTERQPPRPDGPGPGRAQQLGLGSIAHGHAWTAEKARSHALQHRATGVRGNLPTRPTNPSHYSARDLSRPRADPRRTPAQPHGPPPLPNDGAQPRGRRRRAKKKGGRVSRDTSPMATLSGPRSD